MVKINSNFLLITGIGVAVIIGIGALLIAFTQIEGTRDEIETFSSD